MNGIAQPRTGVLEEAGGNFGIWVWRGVGRQPQNDEALSALSATCCTLVTVIQGGPPGNVGSEEAN